MASPAAAAARAAVALREAGDARATQARALIEYALPVAAVARRCPNRDVAKARLGDQRRKILRRVPRERKRFVFLGQQVVAAPVHVARFGSREARFRVHRRLRAQRDPRSVGERPRADFY